MKVTTKTLDGGQGSEIELNDDVFGLEPRADILHRAVTWEPEKRPRTRRGARGRGARRPAARGPAPRPPAPPPSAPTLPAPARTSAARKAAAPPVTATARRRSSS